MNKQQIYDLINEMNDETPYSNSQDSISFKAYRKAGQLHDARMFPILKEIVCENEHKRDRNKRMIRNSAYFIGGELLKNVFDHDFLVFFIERLRIETDKYVLMNMLDSLSEIDVLDEVDIGPIIEHTRSEKWQIRFSAITALGSFGSEESRACLRKVIELEDENSFDYEITYAQAAMGRIGTKEDIRSLQKHAGSCKHDVRDSARFAIERIYERYDHEK